MYLYNVSIKLMPSIEQEWLAWLYNEHIAEVLATGLFTEAKLFALLEPNDNEGITYTIQYATDSKDKYQTYIEQHAPALREKGFEKFGNQFIGFRSFVKELRTFKPL